MAEKGKKKAEEATEKTRKDGDSGSASMGGGGQDKTKKDGDSGSAPMGGGDQKSSMKAGSKVKDVGDNE